jgi:hypothetical protein
MRVSEIALGTLERLDAREVWTNEAYDFTPWLRRHIHVLGQALGLEIDVDVQQEVAVGLFSADLLGTDLGSSASILIENQLAQTDHSHLGQLLTYAGGLDTSILVWVSTKVREEHRQALTWLNERTHEDVFFFAVEIELLRIDGSKPAPHFKVVVAPNEWQKSTAPRSVASRSGTLSSERGERYKEFWRGLLAKVLALDAAATTASAERVPAQSWYGISIGRSGFLNNFAFSYQGSNKIVRTELYIDVGDKLQNEAIFEVFARERATIETEFGERLTWDRREDVRHCQIYVTRPGSLDDAPEALEDLSRWGAERLIRFRDVFGPRAKRLALPLPVPSPDVDPGGPQSDEGAADPA